MYRHSLGKLYLGDCRRFLKRLNDNSIDLILTDPPYFIDGMDANWNNNKLHEKASKSGVIGGRPIGMKFDRQQSYNFQEFLNSIADDCFRILKPGGFLVCFSQARLFHRAAVSFEDAGFEIRDMLAWHHNGQAKAFTQNHFILKNNRLSAVEKQELIDELNNRKTPQLKPQLEPMVFAQKPKEGTFVENWIKWKTGLIDTNQSLDESFPGNLMPVSKPSKNEKGDFNNHLTVKPVRLLKHLISLLTIPNQIVLDPFIGSGSTALACINSRRRFIGIEKDKTNFAIAEKRISNDLEV